MQQHISCCELFYSKTDLESTPSSDSIVANTQVATPVGLGYLPRLGVQDVDQERAAHQRMDVELYFWIDYCCLLFVRA